MKHFVLIGLLLASCISSAKGLDALYEVPGFDNAPEAQFPMTFKIEQNGDDVSVDYTLPDLLTGVENRIHADGIMRTPSLAVLNGPKSHITCDIPNKLCSVVYKNLDIDLDVVENSLTRAGFTPDQIKSRLAVAQKFKFDPEGVIHFGGHY